MAYVAALDQGTTSTRCILFDGKQRFQTHHQLEHTQITPQPGWLEHSPEEIVTNALECLRHVAINAPEPIAALGITNQRETTVAWSHNTGRSLCNAIVWSDIRTEGVVEYLSKKLGPRFAEAVSGLPCSTYFSAVKMVWLLENVAAVRSAADSGDLRFGTMDSWLIYRLTEGKHHVTDCTNASRTMLMDIRTLAWSPTVCDMLGISVDWLPRIVSSSEHICDITIPGHPPIPLSGCIGDQQGALVGHRCFTPGAMKNTYGTGCFLLAHAGTTVPSVGSSGLLPTVGYKFGSEPTVYAVEGAVAGAGSTLQWLRDKLQIITDAKHSEVLARQVPDAGGVVFVPAFGGLLAPYWRPDARGTIVGMTQQTTRQHIVRAALDAVAQQVTTLVRTMEAVCNVRCDALAVDGGMSRNTLLMQMQADSLGTAVQQPNMAEVTALGAAACAAEAMQAWPGWRSQAHSESGALFRPSTTAAQRQEAAERWQRGVERAVGWSKL